jgi:hypothetical protein
VMVHPAGKQLSLVARAFLDFMLAESRTLVFDHLSRP